MTPADLARLEAIEMRVETSSPEDDLMAEADLLREIITPARFHALPVVRMNLNDIADEVVRFAGHGINGASRVVRLDDARVFIVIRWECGIAIVYLNHALGVGLLDVNHDGKRRIARMRCVSTLFDLPDGLLLGAWGDA